MTGVGVAAEAVGVDAEDEVDGVDEGVAEAVMATAIGSELKRPTLQSLPTQARNRLVKSASVQ